MLDFTFYHKDGSVKTLIVSEQNYEKLCNAGLGKLVISTERELIIEGEKYEVDVIELSQENRNIILRFIEQERHKELEKLFSEIEDNPTIKEIREQFDYVKLLTSFYSNISKETYEYFSY